MRNSVKRLVSSANWFCLALVGIILLHDAVAVGQRRPQQQQSPQNYQAKDMAYRMARYYLLLVRQKASLDEQAEPIDDSKREEMKGWLSGLGFQTLPEPQKSDLQECRRSMLYYMDRPTGTILSPDTLTEMLAVLIDFQIDERSLKQVPDPRLADGIRLWLLVSKTSTLTNWKVDTDQSDKINLVARLFVEYLAISLTFTAERRPIKAQAALLAMDPSQVKDPNARADFTKLHGDLLELSRTVSVIRDAATKAKVMNFSVDRFSILRRKYQIPYNQIFRYCGPSLSSVFDSMRKAEQ